MNIPYDEMDKDCVPIVKFFNDVGLKTSMCCQGHNLTNMSLFWVEFDKSITESDILKFMAMFKRPFPIGKYFVSNGTFAERIILYKNGAVGKRWRYVAASSIAANDDLRRWKENSGVIKYECCCNSCV